MYYVYTVLYRISELWMQCQFVPARCVPERKFKATMHPLDDAPRTICPGGHKDMSSILADQ